MQTSQKKNMAESQLFTNDISDKRILETMGAIAREEFVPEQLKHCAYSDADLAVGNGRFQLAPLTFAKLLDLAEITPSCRVLTVGCLSGYSAAILAPLAGHVVAVDIDDALVLQAKMKLASLRVADVDVQTVKALTDGYALSAPYDVIVIEGAVDVIPESLSSQLGVNGRLVAIQNIEKRPGIRGGLGRGMLVKRTDHYLSQREHFDCAGVLLPGFTRAAGFAF